MSNVSLINGHIDDCEDFNDFEDFEDDEDDDIWEFIGDDTYKCRKCETKIYVDNYLDLPPYCKECEKWK